MPLIPEAELERIKRDVPIVELVREAGIELSRHGAKDLAGRCPFHEPDETGSLVVSPGSNLWHCFGCGAAGNVLQWEMKLRGVGFPEAVERLRSRSRPRVECPFHVGMSDGDVLLAAVGHYHRTLLASPEALAYLERRGLRDEEMIERFRFGYADRSLGTLLPEKNRVAGASIRGQLQSVGLWRESGHELMRGSLVIPVFDEAGEVAQIYGRKINDNLRAGTPKHLYLPRPLSGVWNLDGVRGSAEVIVCEAVLDAATLWRWGHRNVTAAFGVEGFTDSHRAVFTSGVERALIAYDGDAGGDRGTGRLAAELTAAGIECFRVPVPRGCDVNSVALSASDARDVLGDLLRRSEWLGKGVRPLVSVPAASAEPPSLAAPGVACEEASAPRAPMLPRPFVVECREEPDGVWFEFGERVYRVRGLEKNTAMGSLRVSVLLVRGDAPHVDTLDLATDLNRQRFGKRAEEITGAKAEVVSRDLTRMFCKLEELQEARIREALTPKDAAPAMSEERRARALEFLRSPNLRERIIGDFRRLGVVGEENNAVVSYLASVSRKLSKPLAVMIQSSSAAGKSSLMEAVLSFVPEEERVKYSAMTGQSLFYMSETDLRHKVLAIVEEEGAERASYALKLLQSEGELTIASTGKDPQTGRLTTHEYRVEGPVMILLTTTAVEIDEELLNRCVVLTVDEDREQTRLIHRMQRSLETIEGLWAEEDRRGLREVHQDAQRLLEPLHVVNPWANELTFLDDRTRTRRDHLKYLVLIKAIALLHQYQRERKSGERDGRSKQYIEATIEDIELANELAGEVFGRTLDELPPQTRRLAGLLNEMVGAGCAREGVARTHYRFRQRRVREYTGWSDFQVKAHLRKLVEMEYVVAHRVGTGYVYELLYAGEGAAGGRFLMGLIDVGKLKGRGYDEEREHRGEAREHSNGDREVLGSGLGGAWEMLGSGGEMSEIAAAGAGETRAKAKAGENAYLDGGGPATSYRTHTRAMPAAGGE